MQNPFQTNAKYYQYLNLVSSSLQPHKEEQMVLASGGEKEGGTKWEVSKALVSISSIKPGWWEVSPVTALVKEQGRCKAS